MEILSRSDLGFGLREAAGRRITMRNIFPYVWKPNATPWLVIPYGKSGTTPRNQAFYNISKPNCRSKLCIKSIPELIGKTYIQKPSHQGWLIVICDDAKYDYSTDIYKYGDCFLWNPSTLETICLPSISKWGDDVRFVDCVLSSPPGGGDESLVFFVFSCPDDESSSDEDASYDEVEGSYSLDFAYCVPGRDTEWKTKEWSSGQILEEDIESLHYFKSKFYLMCAGDLNLEISAASDESLAIKIIEVAFKGSHPWAGGYKTGLSRFSFVATSDQLYSIEVYYSLRGLRKVVIQIAMLRLDLEALEWKMADDIGDHVLFLGSRRTTSACCSAADMGLTRGCLYFTIPDDPCLYKFDVQSASISAVGPRLEVPKKWQGSEFIMMPPHKGQQGNKKRKRSDLVRTTRSQYRPDLALVANLTSRPTKIMMEPDVSSPCLMFCRDPSSTTFSFINPVDNKETHPLMHIHLTKAVVRFQRGGWLLVSVNNSPGLFFYNPFTRDSIELPELPVGYTFSGASFSSLPTLPDCVVFAIEQDTPCQVRIYFIRKGEPSWSSCPFANTDTEKYMPSHNAPVFYKGKFYSVDYNGSIGVFSIEDNHISGEVHEITHRAFGDVYPSFLVECDRDLLVVKLGRLGTMVGIFRLDFSRMQWVKIKDLGNRMLFVSYTSCFSAVAPNSSMQNKVYFPRLCLNGEGVLFYCLKTGSYRSFGSHSASDFTSTQSWSLNCTWVEPNLSESTGKWMERPSEFPWVEPKLSMPAFEELA